MPREKMTVEEKEHNRQERLKFDQEQAVKYRAYNWQKEQIYKDTILRIKKGNDPKGYLVVHVELNGVDLFQIWCRSISMFPFTGTPFDCYCLKSNGEDIAGICAAQLIDETGDLKYIG